MKIHDRGNLNWQPFLLPEHRALLRELKNDDQKAEMPTLDQQQLEEFNQIICDAMAFNQPLEITYYQNGRMKQVICHVHYIDTHQQELRIRDQPHRVCIIKINQIANIQLADGY